MPGTSPRSGSTPCASPSTTATSRTTNGPSRSRRRASRASTASSRYWVSTASARSSTCTPCPATRTSTGTATTPPTARRSGITRTSRTASCTCGRRSPTATRTARRSPATTPSTSPPMRAARSCCRLPAAREGRARDRPAPCALPRRQSLLDRLLGVLTPQRAAREHRVHSPRLRPARHHERAGVPGRHARRVLRSLGRRADLPAAHAVHA